MREGPGKASGSGGKLPKPQPRLWVYSRIVRSSSVWFKDPPEMHDTKWSLKCIGSFRMAVGTHCAKCPLLNFYGHLQGTWPGNRNATYSYDHFKGTNAFRWPSRHPMCSYSHSADSRAFQWATQCCSFQGATKTGPKLSIESNQLIG